MNSSQSSRNGNRIIDKKWTEIFNDLDILNEIQRNKFFKIKSSIINKYKEARLMTKFDHISSLPDIFFRNKLSILPITRREYVIGKFNAYTDISDKPNVFSKNIKETSFPQWIQSIDPLNVTSESTMLNIAEISGMLKDLLAENSIFSTVNGRMGSEDFSFKINEWNTSNNLMRLSVDKSQMEIDAGFETEHSLALIEAKNHTASSLLTRQLYYPYRLWKKRLPNKKIIPIYLQYDSGIYNFSIFNFKDPENYSSIELINRQNYMLGQETISIGDIINISKNVPSVKEPTKAECVFPQADSLQKVMDIINLLQTKNNKLSREDLTLELDFVYRQAYYYADAGKYLNIFKLNENKFLELTPVGLKFKHLNQKDQRLLLAKQILEHKPFNYVFTDALNNQGTFERDRTYKIIKEHNFLKEYGESTIIRRSQTINAWLRTLLSFADDY